MRGWLILGAVVLFAACQRPRPAGTQSEAGGQTTPLKQVEKILTGEQPAKEPVPEVPEGTEPGKPVVPVAEPVPDKPGFVISPYNGKWIDVTGVKTGEVMADPHFADEEKKYFKVPAFPEPPAEEARPAEETEPAAEAGNGVV